MQKVINRTSSTIKEGGIQGGEGGQARKSFWVKEGEKHEGMITREVSALIGRSWFYF